MSAKDHIDQLKKVEVPVWASVLGMIRAWRRRRKARRIWHHVATLVWAVYWDDTRRTSYGWYILRENEAGQREFEYTTDHPLLEDDAKNNGIYAQVVSPWVLGRWTNRQIQDFAHQQQQETRRSTQ